MTGIAEVSAPTKDSINAVPSVTSYNTADHQTVGPSDGSVASNSVQGAPVRTGTVSPTHSAGPALSPSNASNITTPSLQNSGMVANEPQQQQQHSAYPAARDRSGLTSSDDDQTEPSSTNNSDNMGYTRSDANDDSATSTFGRLVESTKKRLNTNDRRRENADDGEVEALENALIYGYLQKMGRNGKWQTRWFETDGECLTYYKSSKRVKLLATLDLAKVGSILINRQDRSCTSFTINISDRPYHLRADSVAACKDWVIRLNRVKEARMLEGNVKLAKPAQQPPDLLDTYTPKVVVVTNRPRTRAIDDDDMQSWENGAPWTNPADDDVDFSRPSSGRLARWQKPRTTISRLASKLAKWARSIRKIGSCQDAEDHVVLDHHLHPPGHDDKEKTKKVSGGMSDPITIPPVLSSDKSAKAEDMTGAVGQSAADDDDEDDGIRYLS